MGLEWTLASPVERNLLICVAVNDGFQAYAGCHNPSKKCADCAYHHETKPTQVVIHVPYISSRCVIW